jgi:hypothetical protein
MKKGNLYPGEGIISLSDIFTVCKNLASFHFGKNLRYLLG